MKKVVYLIAGLSLFMFLVSCSGFQKPDPKVMACQAGCDEAYESCIKKAGKSEAKKAACEAAKTKCYSDCEKQ